VGGACSTLGEMRNSYRISVGNLKRTLGRCTPRWDNIRMNLKDIEWEGVN